MRVLVAIDLEEQAHSPLVLGRDLLDRLGATLDLLHVEALTVPIGLDEDGPDLDTLIEGSLERRLERLRSRLRALAADAPASLRGEAFVERHPRVADAIVAHAAEHDLVVVGTHGHTGPSRLWLGSVAEKVVRTSPVPVLVVRGPAGEVDPSRVLVAVDAFDEDAVRILAEASRWSDRLGAVCDLVHVVDVPITREPVLGRHRFAWAADIENLERAARERLEALHAALPERARGTVRVLRGPPAMQIAEASAGYALTIVGAHRRRGLSRLWLGSVAERVVRTAAGSVLVVRLR